MSLSDFQCPFMRRACLTLGLHGSGRGEALHHGHQLRDGHAGRMKLAELLQMLILIWEALDQVLHLRPWIHLAGSGHDYCLSYGWGCYWHC